MITYKIIHIEQFCSLCIMIKLRESAYYLVSIIIKYDD